MPFNGLTSLDDEARQRITKLSTNVHSMREEALKIGDPTLAAMIEYLGSAVIRLSIHVEVLEKQVNEHGPRIECVEEWIEERLEALDP